MTGGFYGIHWGQRAEIVFFHLRLSCEIVISKNAIASPSRFINSICLIKEINHCVNWKYVNKHPRRVPKAASSAANREWAEKNVRKARWISVMNYLRNNELSCSRAIHFRNIFRPPQWQISILAFPIWELALISLTKCFTSIIKIDFMASTRRYTNRRLGMWSEMLVQFSREWNRTNQFEC